MIIKGLEMPKEELTLTIWPNGWVYKIISKNNGVLLDGVEAQNETKDKITNADYIRAMTDEELAVFLSKVKKVHTYSPEGWMNMLEAEYG